jgi:hypothetical protein
MLGLFKRTKVKKWETDLLVKVFSLLPEEFAHYKEQVNVGILKGVFFLDSPYPNYVGFSFNPTISKKFEIRNGRYFRLRGIEVYDKKKLGWCEFVIYLSHGVVCGYATHSKNFLPDVSKINLHNFKKEYLDEEYAKEIVGLFSESDFDLVNPADVYEVFLNGKTYYHVKDIGDGDFIGVDAEKNVYKVTHDPFEITLLEGDLSQTLEAYE